MKASGSEISARLRVARTSFNLNQKDFASKSGVGFSTYQKYEMGMSVPGGEAIEGFVRLGINANWILTGEGEMLLADQRAKLEKISKEVFGDAPLRVAQNPNVEYDAALKRIAEATQATVRISRQFDFALPVEWSSLIQELMAIHGLTEAGAKRVIEALKHQT